MALNARPAVTQVSRGERGEESGSSSCTAARRKTEKKRVCGGERDSIRDTRQEHYLLQLAGPVEAEVRMRKEASETEVDLKVMCGVTGYRVQESRGSQLKGPDFEHLCIRDGRKARHFDRPCGPMWYTPWTGEKGQVRRGRHGVERQSEESHHDIFCFPTQMAMSSAVRA